jgi:AraC-like DNA-binding protein
MQTAFCSEHLAGDDRSRLSAWRDFLAGVYGRHDVSTLTNRPFFQRLEMARYGGDTALVDVLRFSGTTDRMSWISRGNAELKSSHFVLCFNQCHSPLSFSQLGRDVVLNGGTPVLMNCRETGDIRSAGTHDFLAVAIDQTRLRELVLDIEDLVAKPLPENNPALRHLKRYLEVLPTAQEAHDNPELEAIVGTTLTDLVVLVLGATRDAAEVARTRGIRGARLREVITEIRKRYADPDFSPQIVARRLAVTERYIQDLLQETGTSFTQRVLELRLQRARSMLVDQRYDQLKIGEIASASGFNEIPYFNRCFRRRFGTTPTQFRG